MTTAKSNAKINLLINTPGTKIKVPAIFAEQFEMLYLDINQKHDFKIISNDYDKSKFGQFSAVISTQKDSQRHQCNVSISNEALLALNNVKYIIDLSDLELFAKFKADRFEINLNIPDHVCNSALRPVLNSTSSRPTNKPVDSLAELIGIKTKISTPSSTAYGDDDYNS